MEQMKEWSWVALQGAGLALWWAGKASGIALAVSAWICLMMMWVMVTLLFRQRLPRPIDRLF